MARFFWGAGVRIYEGYGLSETSPVLTVNRPGRPAWARSARPSRESSCASPRTARSSPADPTSCVGYHRLPEETAAAIDDEGWFHTGDIGEFDERGTCKITDRKKEIIVNAYGKNVAPAPIENALKASPYVGHVVIIGDRRKFLSALLVPDFDTLAAVVPQHDISTTTGARR